MWKYQLLAVAAAIGFTTQASAQKKGKGFTINPAIYYGSNDTSSAPTKRKTDLTVDGVSTSTEEDITTESSGTFSGYNLDLGVGFILDSGIYLGAKIYYASGTSNSTAITSSTSTSTTSSGTTTVTTQEKTVSDLAMTDTGLGLSIGFVADGGFNVMGSYLFSYSRAMTGSSTTTDQSDGTSSSFDLTGSIGGASAIMVDIGYRFMTKSGIGLGPQFVYRSVSWTEEIIEYSVPTSTTSFKQTDTGTFSETDITPYVGIWFHF